MLFHRDSYIFGIQAITLLKHILAREPQIIPTKDSAMPKFGCYICWLICVECGYCLPVLNLSSMQHILYTMIQEKMSSEVIEMERQAQEEKQEIQQPSVMNSKGGSDNNGIR